MVQQRLPLVNSDDGVWGDILRQYLMKEHFNDDTNNAANGGHQKITVLAGTTAAGTAPIKLTSGPLMTTSEAGAIEFLSDKLYFTSTTGPTRKTVATYDDTSGATGDLYYRDSGGNFVRLGIGSTNNVLTVTGGIPAWTASPSLTTPVLNGIPTGTGVSATAAANTLALRDSSANLITNAFIPNLTSTVTAAGTTTLVVGSSETQVFTGTSTQTVTLPTTSVVAGQRFTINNQSTGNLTVNSSGGNLITILPFSQTVVVTALVSTPTTAAQWACANAPSTFSSTTANGNSVAQRNGSGNLVANVFVPNLTSVATAGGTTAFSVTSSQIVVFTGTTTQIATLPTTSVSVGHTNTIINNSTGAVTVNASGGTLIRVLQAGQSLVATANTATPTTNAHWNIIGGAPAGDIVGTTDTQTLTNKSFNSNTNAFTLRDTGLQIVNVTDTTKVARFSSASISPSSTRVFTLPDYDSTLATQAGTETLTNKTLTNPVLNGAITGTGIASTASPSVIVQRDGNANALFNNIINGFSTTTTSGTTTTLTMASSAIQAFTGSTTQTVTLPTSGVPFGAQYTIINKSTGVVTVQSSGANTITAMAAGTTATFTALVAIPTTAANWNSSYVTSGSSTFSDTAFTLQDNGDTTKQLQFELTGITTGTTRTLTIPDASTTIVGTDTTQTLTNKTMTSSTNTFVALDTKFAVVSNADITKGGRLVIPSSQTTGTTRLHTLPDVDSTLASLAGTETLTNKTLTTPTIASFANATHNHTNAVGGGQITDAALSSAVTVAKGGTGQTTLTTAYGLLAAGTTATGAVQTLAAGATTDMLVGGGASALPVWTTATGTGAPVRTGSPTLTTPVLTGLPTGSGVASAATASTLAARDTNANLTANAYIPGFRTQVSSASTVTLTIADKQIQEFTGTTQAQTVILPTTSIVAGMQYTIVNNITTAAVTVQSSGANTIATMAAGTTATFTAVVATPTTAANWDSNYVSGGSGTVTATAGSLTSNSVVLGAGTTDTKVSTGITTNGASQLNLGVNATTAGKVKMFGGTSGDVTLQPTAAAGTATALTLPASTDTLVGRATVDTLTNKTLTAPKVDELHDSADGVVIVLSGGGTQNALSVSNSNTGVAPAITALGGDADVSINMVPKGTGTLQASGVPVVTTTGTQTLTNKTLTTPVLNGIPTGTGVSTSATANTLALRDANGSTAMANLLEGYTTTATSGGTLTLTVASNQQQFFTGSSAHTLVLPVTSTLSLGFDFIVTNNSTGAVTVQSSGANNILILAAGTSATLTCILTSGTTAASWSYAYLGQVSATGKKLTVSNSLTLAGTDSTTMTFPTTNASIARTDAAQTFTGVQTLSSSPVLSSGAVTVSGNTVTFPTGAVTLASTADITNATASLSTKTSVRAVTTGAETFTISAGTVTQIAGTTVDGVSVAVGDRILVKDAPAATGVASSGSTQSGNGIYTVSAVAANISVSRATDMSGTYSPLGASVVAQAGSFWLGCIFSVITPSSSGAFTYGTNNIAWSSGIATVGAITSGTATFSNKTLIDPRINNSLRDLNGNKILDLWNDTSPVNFIAVANRNLGGSPYIAADGADTNIDIALNPKGSGRIYLWSASNTPTIVGDGPAGNNNLNLVTGGTGIVQANGVAVARKYSATIGNGASTSIAVTHNLGTQDVTWSIRDATTNEYVDCDVTSTSTTQITFTFATAPATNAYKVVIIG